MTVAVVDVELLGEVLTGERNRPRGRVNTDYFRRFVECIHESLVILLGEFGGTTGSWLVVDDGLERLGFEPFETIDPLRGPAFGESVEFGGSFLGEIIDLFVGDRCH